MPVIAAAAAGLLATAAATAGATALGASLVVATFVGSVAGLIVSTGVSLLLNRAPKVASVEAQASDRKQAVRSGVAPRNIVYGRALVAGPVIYMASAGTYSEYMHIVMPLAGHALNGFLFVRLNGFIIPVADYTAGANGTTGSGVDATAGFTGRIFVRIPANQEQGEIDSADISTSAYPSTDLKRDAQVKICLYDGTQTAAPADLLGDMPADWDSNMKLLGIPFIHLTVRYSTEVFPGGFQSLSVEVRGKALWDPRTDTEIYTDNAALAALDYLLSEYGLGVPSSEIDTDAVAAAANIADELVAIDLAATAFESRYTTNGSFKLDQAPADIMDALLNGWGVCTYVQGLYRLHAAASEASTLSLTESDFAGALEVVRNHPRRENYNRVSGTYVEPAQGWEPLPFPTVQSSVYLAIDDEQVGVTLDLPFQISAFAAQRLARLRLLSHRGGGFQIRAALKYSAIQAAIWDTVDVTIGEFGLGGDPFRLTRWQFDPMSGLVNVVLQYEDPDQYSWTASDGAEPVLSDPTDLANPLVVPEGEEPTVTVNWRVLTDGTIQPYLRVTWTADIANPYITAVEIQFKNDTVGDAWNARIVPSTESELFIEPIVSADSYKVRLRYHAGVVRGAWSPTVTITGEGAETDTPAAPTGGAVTAILGGYRVTFTKATAPDIAATEIGEDVDPIEGTIAYVGETSGDVFVRMTASGDYAPRQIHLRSRNTAVQRSAWSAISGTVTPQTATTVDLTANAVTDIASAGFIVTEAPAGAGWEATTASVNVTVAAGEKVIIFWRARLEDYDGSTINGGGAEGGQDPGA